MFNTTMAGIPTHYEPEIAQVSEGLFVGNGAAAMSYEHIKRHAITGIVTVASQYRPNHEGVVTSTQGLTDEFDGMQRNTDAQIHAAVDAVIEMRRQHKTVLLHCHKGHNRSAAIAAGVLAALGPMPTFEAYGRVAAAKHVRVEPRLLRHVAKLFG